MTSGPALSCPSCKRALGPESWTHEHEGRCARCDTRFEFLAFPALKATRARIAPQAAMLEADSVCFFHAENRAEAICDGCGRLLCPVCAVPFAGQKLCPTCIAAGRTSGAPALIRDRPLWDGIALALALVPLVIFPLAFLSIGTAPATLGVVIYGWNKPGSLVRGPSRWRFIVAGLLAVAEIAGWVTLGIFLWMRR
jgi:hypothetical protein